MIRSDAPPQKVHAGHISDPRKQEYATITIQLRLIIRLFDRMQVALSGLITFGYSLPNP
jgi:hypothetical protein